MISESYQKLLGHHLMGAVLAVVVLAPSAAQAFDCGMYTRGSRDQQQTFAEGVITTGDQVAAQTNGRPLDHYKAIRFVGGSLEPWLMVVIDSACRNNSGANIPKIALHAYNELRAQQGLQAIPE